MSASASWSYTAKATIWRNLGKDETGDPLGYSAPQIIDVDYEGGLSKRLGNLGAEIVVKNTVWSEYALATVGDYLLLGESSNADPVEAGADEIMLVTRFADTFDRLADDWALVTGG